MSTESSIEEQTPVEPCPHFHGFNPNSGLIFLCRREDWESEQQLRLKSTGVRDRTPVAWFKFCPECGKQLVDDLSENLMPFVQDPLHFRDRPKNAV